MRTKELFVILNNKNTSKYFFYVMSAINCEVHSTFFCETGAHHPNKLRT